MVLNSLFRLSTACSLGFYFLFLLFLSLFLYLAFFYLFSSFCNHDMTMDLMMDNDW